MFKIEMTIVQHEGNQTMNFRANELVDVMKLAKVTADSIQRRDPQAQLTFVLLEEKWEPLDMPDWMINKLMEEPV